MDELIADYESGALHPADVKPALAKAINEILQVIDLALFNVILLSF
jgi:tyrosyl-tRNA synthetase